LIVYNAHALVNSLIEGERISSVGLRAHLSIRFRFRLRQVFRAPEAGKSKSRDTQRVKIAPAAPTNNILSSYCYFYTESDARSRRDLFPILRRTAR
jgi:hypothetical protein